MNSEIWKLSTQHLGKMETFGSERDMEAFLMNYPTLLGCGNYDLKNPVPTLVHSQIPYKTPDGKTGRIDIVGIAKVDDLYELRIFELKQGEIDGAAVRQLRSYLAEVVKDERAVKKVRDLCHDRDIEELDENAINELLKKPVGILVGARFSAEAISEALNSGIRGLRLARFKDESKGDYYVIVEEQVGQVSPQKRKSWSWRQLLDKGLIEESDEFRISYEGKELRGCPDRKFLNYNTIKLVLSEESTELLLAKERDIAGKAVDKDGKIFKWISTAIEALKKREGIYISSATGLSFYAFGGPTASYWVPTAWWTHIKSSRSLASLRDELYKKS